MKERHVQLVWGRSLLRPPSPPLSEGRMHSAASGEMYRSFGAEAPQDDKQKLNFVLVWDGASSVPNHAEPRLHIQT